ncbi:AmmeMemoRadiSam system protein B [Myxococcota bacterium]
MMRAAQVVMPGLIVSLVVSVIPSCKKKKPPDDDQAFEGKKVIRPAVKAGTWYTDDGESLSRELDRYLVSASLPEAGGRLVGLVSPHAGYRFSGPTAGHGFKLLGKQRGIRRVIVMGVSHHHRFSGVSIPEVTHYQTPLGLLRLDIEAAKELRRHRPFTAVPEAHANEHSVELQMPFLKRINEKVRILPMVVWRLSSLDLKLAAERLAPLIDDQTVVVASSDFTHRGGAVPVRGAPRSR